MTTDSFNVSDKATTDAQPFPLTNTCIMVDHHNHHRPSSSSEFGSAAATVGSGGFRNLQPFDISYTHTAITAFKSPGEMMMGASLGFPFTSAQWKELERQAMIYKYMMASVPVPPHLLIPVSNSSNPYYSDPAAAALNMKFTNGADLEPGRCRRTDGKKWRCSRDVAPDQKYCERHMHRGRPRSRKPVEIDATNKKSRRTPVSNPTVNYGAGAAASQPYNQATVFLDKPNCKVGFFDSSLASGGLKWAMKREAKPEPVQQWPPEIGPFGENLGNFSAWSNNASSDDHNSNTSCTTGLLSLGVNCTEEKEEMGRTPMGLGLIESNQNQKYCIKGGPLAEVVQLSRVSTKAYQSSSPIAENGDCDHSPKGVLLKTVVSFSDSSGNSSPSLSSSVRIKSDEI